MQIVEPYARMVKIECREHGIELLRHVEWAARVSHRSEDSITETSWERFLKAVVLQRGDWSVTEHASVTVDALVDRGITHEWVRHRIGAYTQESTRFCNYGKGGEIKTIMPPLGANKESGTGWSSPDVWHQAVENCEKAYLELLKVGVAPQIARSVLPIGIAARIVTTYNLRNWRHFLLMRTTREAHPQMRQVTIPLLAEFKAKIPILYDDIEPEQSQAEALRRAR